MLSQTNSTFLLEVDIQVVICKIIKSLTILILSIILRKLQIVRKILGIFKGMFVTMSPGQRCICFKDVQMPRAGSHERTRPAFIN